MDPISKLIADTNKFIVWLDMELDIHALHQIRDRS